jgi:hypothetical protein
MTHPFYYPISFSYHFNSRLFTDLNEGIWMKREDN